MSSPTQTDLAHSGTLEELYGKLDRSAWGRAGTSRRHRCGPRRSKTFVPAHWRYELARGALDAAGRLINTALAERRNLILFNPTEGNAYATVRTLVAAYQMIMPGEWARVHRHTPNALRLILDAEPGTYTEVDGANIAMLPGDVLLTPNWSTHGHGNHSKACAYWLDFLDVPLVQLLEPMFFEPAEEEDNSRANGRARPRRGATNSPFVFPHKETLDDSPPRSPTPPAVRDQVELGHPALATIGAPHDEACAAAWRPRLTGRRRTTSTRWSRAAARPRLTANASTGGAAT